MYPVAMSNRMVPKMVRIDPDINDRLDRLLLILKPKFGRVLGSSFKFEAPLIRAALEIGIGIIEKEHLPLHEQVEINLDKGSDMCIRINRIEKCIAPRIKNLTGSHPSRNEIVRSLIFRGIKSVEKEYDLDEVDIRHILIEE